MNAERWKYLKELQPSKGRCISKPGVTLNLGRNKDKRAIRAMAAARRALSKSVFV
jgi:hypothetical protein